MLDYLLDKIQPARAYDFLTALYAGVAGGGYLLAQEATLTAGDWTAFSLLGSTLVAVGLFLRWYLPSRDKAFERMLEAQRTDFAAALRMQAASTADLFKHTQESTERILSVLEKVSGERSFRGTEGFDKHRAGS